MSFTKGPQCIAHHLGLVEQEHQQLLRQGHVIYHPHQRKQCLYSTIIWYSVFKQEFITIYVSRASSVKASYIKLRRPSVDHVP